MVKNAYFHENYSRNKQEIYKRKDFRIPDTN